MGDLVGSAAPTESAESAEGSSSPNYKEIIVTKEGGLLTITLNRPKKYNAINYQVRGNTRITTNMDYDAAPNVWK